MNSQLCLFSAEIIEEDEEPKEIKIVTRGIVGRRHDLKNPLLGRCLVCGGHISKESGQCLECLNSQYCNCHHCAQIASIHRELQNELYWLNQDFGLSMESRYREKGYTGERLQAVIDSFLRNRETNIEKAKAKIATYRNIPFCREVSR